MIELVFCCNPQNKQNARLLLLLFLTVLLSPSPFAYSLDPEEARTLIRTGENALTSTFENVLKADRVDANVSILIQKLNEAADILMSAKASLEKGMLNDVLDLTRQSMRLTEEVNEEAVGLHLSKLTQRESEFRFNLLLMIVGIPCFSFFMFFLWRWFKGYYLQASIQNSRPEVSEVEP